MRSLPCFTSDLCWRSIVLKDGLFKQGLVEQPPHIQPVWVNGSAGDQPYHIPLPWVYYDIQQGVTPTMLPYYARTPVALRSACLFSIKCLYFSPTRLTRADQTVSALSLPPLPNVNSLHEVVCYPRGVAIPAHHGLPDYMTPQAWKPLTEKQKLARMRRLLTVDCHRPVEQQIIKWWDARFNMAYRHFVKSPLFAKVAPGAKRSTLSDVFRMWEEVTLEEMLAFPYPRDAKYVVPALTRSCFDEHGQRRAQYAHAVRKVEGKTKAKKAKGHA